MFHHNQKALKPWKLNFLSIKIGKFYWQFTDVFFFHSFKDEKQNFPGKSVALKFSFAPRKIFSFKNFPLTSTDVGRQIVHFYVCMFHECVILTHSHSFEHQNQPSKKYSMSSNYIQQILFDKILNKSTFKLPQACVDSSIK